MNLEESDRLLARALQVIPLGSQTFSKSHQQFMRGSCPQFLRKGKGCTVEDVDGNRYIDYVLGLLPIVLGYCDDDVNAAIIDQLGRGITFSLPTDLEAELAERLVKLIPCAEMVRFGKNGSDATSAAIRLARAYTGRDRVISCGYHGWHDWYIATTSRDLGIPAEVAKLTTAVPYNNPDAVLDVLASDPDGIAALILEPAGATEPETDYLQSLREATARHGVVLIFDEIVTGFRIDIGGAQSHYAVTPDLACFGKAMANGMPISAIVGKSEIMQLMDEIFYSGTFGGEALSLAASIATIDKLEREDGITRIRNCGRRLIQTVNSSIASHGLDHMLRVTGAEWWPRWQIIGSAVDGALAVSLLRQAMAENGLLMLSTFNLCLAHDTNEMHDRTLTAVERSLITFKAAIEAPDPATHLKGSLVKPTFAVRPS